MVRVMDMVQTGEIPTEDNNKGVESIYCTEENPQTCSLFHVPNGFAY